MVVVDGRRIEIPGVRSIDWHENPAVRLKLGEDGGTRADGVRPRNVVLHTTNAPDDVPQVILPGVGPVNKSAENNAIYWRRSPHCAGAHLIVAPSGYVVCTADLATEYSNSAGLVNKYAIGIEIVDTLGAGKTTLWQCQFAAVLAICRFLAETFGIQEQLQWPYHGSARPVPRLAAGAADVYGFYGHNDVTKSRGPNDPGQRLKEYLMANGFEGFDFAADADKTAWKARQQALGATPDGIPGPATVAALRGAGYAHGLWSRGKAA